jgi:hypothetical protein
MIRTLTTIAFATLMTSAAFAAGPACSTSPASKFKPQASLEAVLKSEGLTMKKLKVEKGCYEVYAIDKKGKKVNVAYNAETLEKTANPEAGEN